MNLDFLFKSPDHLRYKNGRHVSGPHGRARRAIKVEPNIDGAEGHTVTIYNLDGSHPIWQNNVQMAPKQMKIVDKTNEKVVLRGFGADSLGNSFSDYGLSISYNSAGEVEQCILHMHDRNVDIVYMKYTKEDELKDKTIANKKAEHSNLLEERKRRAEQQTEFTEGRIDLDLCVELQEHGILEIVEEYNLRKDFNWSHWMKIIGTWNDNSVYRMNFDINNTERFPMIGQIEVEFVQTREEYES